MTENLNLRRQCNRSPDTLAKLQAALSRPAEHCYVCRPTAGVLDCKAPHTPVTTSFSASAQGLGYLFQARRALWVLLRGSEESEVSIEGLDDVEHRDLSGELRLEQLKHHITKPANLADSSEDLWKTLRVWASHLLAGHFDPAITKLALVTTSAAAPGSIAALLRDGRERDPAAAVQRLREVRSQSKNKALEKSFEAFDALKPFEQDALVAAIRVFDNSPDILDLESLIKRDIRYSTTRAHLDAVYERLEGWWFALVAAHLASPPGVALTHVAVHEKLISIADQFREDNLPIDFLEALPDTLDAAGDGRLFVQQLRAITDKNRRIENAIIDYYRAVQQRGRWVREDLLVDEDLATYEKKLVDEWERERLALEDEAELDLDDSVACRAFGVRLYNWMERQADVPIRPQVREGYVMRGSFHMLAERSAPRVWWHPLFLARLHALVSP